MYRIACLRIPRFQIAVHQKHEPALKKKPLALISQRASTPLTNLNASAQPVNISRAKIFMCSAEAAKSGIYSGMQLAEARAECADLIWRECDDKLYGQAANKLLHELVACSPRVSIQQPGIFLLDASGLQRLGGESQLCRTILRLASRCGYVDGQVGIANSAFSALVATRCRRQRWFIVPPGKDQTFLAPLSIDHLPLTDDLRELFHELGIRSMGQIVQLPAQTLVERFGSNGKDIYELAQGIDNCQPSLPPIEKQFTTSIEVAGPIESLNDTLFLFRAMLDRLAAELKQQMLCADDLLVSFYNDNDKFDERVIPLIRPSNSAKFLVEVIRLTLDAKPLHREFTGLKVTVTSFSRESWEQSQFAVNAAMLTASLVQDPMKAESAVLLLQRFRARVGESALVYPAANDDYFSDNAGVWTPVLQLSKGRSALELMAQPRNHLAERLAPATVPINYPAAEYVLHCTETNTLNSSFVMKRLIPPEPALAQLDQDSRPLAITHRGQWHRILHITAPECLSGHWWDQSLRKSYYLALIERDKQSGMKLISLVHDAETNSWQIEGIFD